MEGTGGYYDEYSELRAHIVCINRRKGWIHTLLNLLKISRFFLKSHFSQHNFAMKSLRSSNQAIFVSKYAMTFVGTVFESSGSILYNSNIT